MTQRAVIIGAAGRDFHNFNVYFRDNPNYVVVAFTAGQLPNIAGRRYPAMLAGARYREGIPIVEEARLSELIAAERVDVAVFSYSDVSHEQVMHLGSEVLAAGADYLLLGPKHTMLRARVPVVAVCAARTGAGKSQTTRRVGRILTGMGKRVAVVRHPMPYGDLTRQAVQQFANRGDLERALVTIEEREEYEPLIAAGFVVFAGVDYERILRRAEADADVVIWDGGNNDLPFMQPDLMIAVMDALRPDHALHYHPGEAVVRMADVILINKIDSAGLEQITTARSTAERLNSRAVVVEAASPIVVDDGEHIRGKRVLVVEDGPTLTHGGMSFGAGTIAARRFGAAELVDPRANAVGSLRQTFAAFPHLGPVLPAMGYGDEQIADLEMTIERTPADLVVVATPIDLARSAKFSKPVVRVRYELQEIGTPTLERIIEERFRSESEALERWINESPAPGGASRREVLRLRR